MAIDYWHLNAQMPFVKSADPHSKGAVSVIPLPKFDELFARLNVQRFFLQLTLDKAIIT